MQTLYLKVVISEIVRRFMVGCHGQHRCVARMDSSPNSSSFSFLRTVDNEHSSNVASEVASDIVLSLSLAVVP